MDLDLTQKRPEVILHHAGTLDGEVRTLTALGFIDAGFPQVARLLKGLLQSVDGVTGDFEFHGGFPCLTFLLYTILAVVQPVVGQFSYCPKRW